METTMQTASSFQGQMSPQAEQAIKPSSGSRRANPFPFSPVVPVVTNVFRDAHLTAAYEAVGRAALNCWAEVVEVGSARQILPSSPTLTICAPHRTRVWALVGQEDVRSQDPFSMQPSYPSTPFPRVLSRMKHFSWPEVTKLSLAPMTIVSTYLVDTTAQC